MGDKVALVYRGSEPHPAHAGFAETIDADIIGLDTITARGLHTSIPGEILNGLLLDEYDIIIAEGTRVLYGIFANQLLRDTTLIYLGGDQALYKLLSDDYSLESGINAFIKKYGVPTLKTLFERYVDGAIVISRFTESYVREFLASDTPVGISRPYIQPSVFDELGEVTPTLDSKTAVTVGANSDYKGVDLLVDAWPLVRREHPEATLKVVGKGHPKKYEQTEGIEVLGFVESLSEIYTQVSLYIQPSRVDGFAVTVVEAMRASVPPIVTTTTGSKVEVTKINESLISEPKASDLAATIIEYFDMSLTEKQSASRQSQSIAMDYRAEIKKPEFKRAYADVLQQIQTTSNPVKR